MGRDVGQSWMLTTGNFLLFSGKKIQYPKTRPATQTSTKQLRANPSLTSLVVPISLLNFFFWKIDISFAQICIALGQAKREHNFDRHLCNSFLGGWPIFRESRRSLCYKWSCSKLFHKFRAGWLLISDSQIKWLRGLSVLNISKFALD